MLRVDGKDIFEILVLKLTFQFDLVKLTFYFSVDVSDISTTNCFCYVRVESRGTIVINVKFPI